MELKDFIDFGINLIQTGEKHFFYDRVKLLAKKYKALITGEDNEFLLKQFIRRETNEMFKQRVNITQAITPAVASSLEKPFNKVARNDKVKKDFDFENEQKNKIIQGMINGWYGNKNSNKGLDYWLKLRFQELTFSDPNAWIVPEWEEKEENEPFEPYPFEVPSENALNFEIKNEELKWLFVYQNIIYDHFDGADTIKKDGIKYTLYFPGLTIVFCQVCPNNLKNTGYEIKNNEDLQEIDKLNFLISFYQTNLNFVPAFRVGYNRDPFTDGKTYVNPWHPAMPFFMKSIKTVSEFDLTMSLHAFPQKLQYVEKCQGESRQKSCHNGFVNGTAEECSACKGSGYKIHTTAQDAILRPMPDDGKDMIKLDDIISYKAPPIDLITFQNEYIQQLKIESHLAVYNSQIFINPDQLIAKTATEIDSNMEGVYDALEPFTEKVSDVWKNLVSFFAHLADVQNVHDYDIIHQFPPDPKLKTTGILISELDAINKSGAPSFMRDAVSKDLASLIYSGDDLGMLKYNVKHKFFPFNGKNPDEIAILMTSPYVSNFTKILYANYEAIFADVSNEKPEFWQLNYSQQWELIKEMTQKYIDELNVNNTPQFDFEINEMIDGEME